MKKWAYLVSGVLIGAVVATSGSAVAAQVKSLIGQKVTGELTVVVNGQELADKGAVINGRTNAPVRALVDALGGSLALEGKTIKVTTDSDTALVPSSNNSGSGTSTSDNPYIGQPEKSLLNSKDIFENRILAPSILRKEKVEIWLEGLESDLADPSLSKEQADMARESMETAQKEWDTLNADIQKYTKQLDQVNEALQALQK